jgi:phenylalanyl-tRNA synthetase beta chain
MPTINIKQTQLKRYLKGSASDEELKEAIVMVGTDMDSYGDEIITEVFPSRPDMLSAAGLARALNFYLGLDNDYERWKTIKGEGVVKVLPSVADVRPHTRCAIVRELVLDDDRIKELIDIQEKLHITHGRQRKRVAVGVYPLEHITLPITYGAEKPSDIVFRPLEHPKELNAKTLLEEHPAGRKYAHLLKGEKKFPVFRDAKEKVLSVPPIINSHDVGKVDENTTDVFIECSGQDPKPLEEALNILCCALIDMGGKVETVSVEYPDWHVNSPDLSLRSIKVDAAYMAARAGIKKEELAPGLAKMGITLDADKAYYPSYRADILHQVDIAEDAAIGHGYNNIKAEVPELYTAGKLSSMTVRDNAVRRVLAGLGLQEVMNFYVSSKGVGLANPLTQDYSALRDTLLKGLLETLGRNVNNTYPQRLFELGPVFSDDESETKVSETDSVACVVCSEDADFTTARQLFEAVSRAMQWTVAWEEHEDERFTLGRCARISGDVNGVVGEIHPKMISMLGVQMPAAAWEISLPQKK